MLEFTGCDDTKCMQCQPLTLLSIDECEEWSYTFLAVGNVTKEGKPVLLGSAVYSTDSAGKLAFLNNAISFFKVEVDAAGNLSIERELK